MKYLFERYGAIKKYILGSKMPALLMVIILLIIIIIYRVIFISIGVHGEEYRISYMEAFWTFISAWSIPISLFSSIRSQKRLEEKQQKEKMNVERNKILIQEIPAFWSALDSIRSLEKEGEKNDEKKKRKQKYTNELFTAGVRTLVHVNSLFDSKIENSNDYIANKTFTESDLYDYCSLICTELRRNDEKRCKQLMQDVASITALFEEFTNLTYDSKTMKKNLIKIIDSKLLSKLFKERKAENKEIVDKNDKVTVENSGLIVRTLNEESTTDDLLGNWKMSLAKAEKINYLIAVYGRVDEEKQLLGIIPVKNPKGVGENRVRFEANGDPLFLGDNDDVKQEIEKKLDNWKFINPVMYL